MSLGEGGQDDLWSTLLKIISGLLAETISQADVLVEGGDVTLIGWGTQVN